MSEPEPPAPEPPAPESEACSPLAGSCPGVGSARGRDAAGREALAYLRAAGQEGRRARRRGAATTLYGLLVVTVMLGGPYLLTAADGSWWAGVGGLTRVRDGLAGTLPALWAVAVLLAARHAAWHGPVGVSLPGAGWALPQPLSRRRLLLPRLAAVTGGGVAVGAVAGAVAGFVLGTLPGGSASGGAGAGAWAGATLAGACVAVGVLVERYDRAVLRLGPRLFAPGWAVVGVLLTLAVWAQAGGVPHGVGRVLLWSGPWGWAVQPLLAAAGGQAPVWPVASGALLALLAAVAVWCSHAAPRVPGDALRRRARTLGEVTASLYSLQFRQARRTVLAPHRRAGRARLRLPVPRHPWLLVPWRDATGLLRAPARLAWAATALAVALTASAAAAGGAPPHRVLLSLLALAALYAAAAQLAEPARVDGDDPRRAGTLPYARGTLALWHAVIPAAALLSALALALGAAALTGAGHPGWPVLFLAAPTMVGAALVSAYRGSMPAHVALGVETPFGNTAPFQMAVWYLRGPLAALLLTAPPLLVAAPTGLLAMPWTPGLLGAAVLHLLWAHHTARRGD
ncbi:hypothetical protein JJV70_11135 [Streptomyces sp. JJ66]|uniref:DUF6297 family protein n=1 Tax=Streptomyces sp. JJ66 TaxID=2803843 RepID=UPI001C59E7B0|nr:DUF6297 family protein [Streptomyces sp. JJ66]MBW1602651.1 hypothetical protein [Streptomyces sp. JJ66]